MPPVLLLSRPLPSVFIAKNNVEDGKTTKVAFEDSFTKSDNQNGSGDDKNKDKGNGSGNNNSGKNGSPKTGDDTPVTLYVVLLMMSILTIEETIRRRKNAAK